RRALARNRPRVALPPPGRASSRCRFAPATCVAALRTAPRGQVRRASRRAPAPWSPSRCGPSPALLGKRALAPFAAGAAQPGPAERAHRQTARRTAGCDRPGNTLRALPREHENARDGDEDREQARGETVVRATGRMEQRL